MNYLSPLFNEQTFDDNGDPLVGGQIYTYVAGTSTPLATYTTQNGVVQHANPIILDARGEPANPIWLGAGQEYKFSLFDANNNLIRTIDDVSGVNDISTDQSEWQVSALVPTYISATSFSVPGDQTLILSVGRRVRTENTGGTVYSTISTSTFGAGITTVVVRNDSGLLDSGLSAIAYGVLAPTNSSLPNSQEVRQTMGLGYGVDIASAAALPLSTVTGQIVRVTGTTATTSVTMNNGQKVTCFAVGAWPLTYNASTMPIPGGYDYTCTAGDIVEFTKDGNGTLSIRIDKFNGGALIDTSKIQPITASVGSNALTVTINPTVVDFRSSTLGSGTVTTVAIPTAISMTVSSGSTLGTTSAIQSDIAVLAINNAGVAEVAVVNTNGGFDLSESGIISTTAEGGAGGADSASVAYSTTARSNVAYRLIGFIRSTQATAGTWATAPSLIQGQGGVSMGQITNVWKGALQTAGGASVELGLTGIPSWIEHIEVTMGGLSTNGTAEVQLQLGTSGGYQTSGYTGTVYDASTNGALTNGFRDNLASAAAVREYTYILNKHDGNTWKCTMGGGLTNTPASRWINGTVTLTGTLDRIRVITSNGTDTIDSGSTLKIRGW